MTLLHLHAALDPTVALLGWLALLPALAVCLLAARRRFLPDGAQQHAWLAGVVCVALLWLLQVETDDGLRFGMLGAALFAIVFGRARAIIGLTAALALYTGTTGGAWINFGIDGLLLAVLPALSACALQRLIEQRLPNNVFVFIIGNGMFATLAATAATSLAVLAASLAAAAPAAAGKLGEYATSSLLLAWGESVVSGMIFSALVIFRPAVVMTYRQEVYLPRSP